MTDIDPEREKLDAMAARIQKATKPKPGESGTGEAAPVKMSRVGFDFMGSVIGSVLIGWLIDRYCDTQPWGILGMVFVGFTVGMINVWRSQNKS